MNHVENCSSSEEDLGEGEGGRVGVEEVGEEADGAGPALVEGEGTVGNSGPASELLGSRL